MKQKLKLALVMAFAGIFATTSLHAQETTTAGQDISNAAKKTGKAVAKGAKKVGNKTAELASKGKSKVVDKTYEGKVGPNGETIYINSKSEYYWVDDKGHHHAITSAELKDKN